MKCWWIQLSRGDRVQGIGEQLSHINSKASSALGRQAVTTYHPGTSLLVQTYLGRVAQVATCSCSSRYHTSDNAVARESLSISPPISRSFPPKIESGKKRKCCHPATNSIDNFQVGPWANLTPQEGKVQSSPILPSSHVTVSGVGDIG